MEAKLPRMHNEYCQEEGEGTSKYSSFLVSRREEWKRGEEHREREGIAE